MLPIVDLSNVAGYNGLEKAVHNVDIFLTHAKLHFTAEGKLWDKPQYIYILLNTAVVCDVSDPVTSSQTLSV